MSAAQNPQKNYTKMGETIYARMEKSNPELLAMLYGSVVTQLLKDYEDIDSVNEILKKMGDSIGGRLVEEFFAKSSLGPCVDFRQTVEVLSKVACKMFLGITANAIDWNDAGTACTLVLQDNPLSDFVELPPAMVGALRYSNLLCGIIQGSLEQLFMKVNCTYVQEIVAGDPVDAIRLELKEILREEFIDDDDDNSGA